MYGIAGGPGRGSPETPEGTCDSWGGNTAVFSAVRVVEMIRYQGIEAPRSLLPMVCGPLGTCLEHAYVEKIFDAETTAVLAIADRL